MTYSFYKGVRKALVSIVLVGLPVAIQLLPTDIANMTLGGLLIILVNFLKVKLTK